MEFNGNEILSCAMVLFAVINIVGSIPVILDIKDKATEIHSVKAALVAYAIMVLFLIAGNKLIAIFGIDIQSFAVAGSFVLFILAVEMILGINIFKLDPKTLKAASIVPIAFPIIAGAGTMTTIISLRAEYEAINIFVAITLNIILVFAVLRLTDKIESVLGDVGIAILQKLFGIILLAISIKLFSSNAVVLLDLPGHG